MVGLLRISVLGFLAASLLGMNLPQPQVAATPIRAVRQGDGPTVALIPVQNTATEVWEDLKVRQNNRANDYLRERFKGHGFGLIPVDRVMTSIKSSQLDFTNPDQQKNGLLYQLGGDLNADYIVLAVIVNTDQGRKNHTLYTDAIGRVTLKLWLLDVKHHKAIQGGTRIEGESSGTRLGIDNKGSDRQVQAAVNAVRDGITAFLSNYVDSNPAGADTEPKPPSK